MARKKNEDKVFRKELIRQVGFLNRKLKERHLLSNFKRDYHNDERYNIIEISDNINHTVTLISYLEFLTNLCFSKYSKDYYLGHFYLLQHLPTLGDWSYLSAKWAEIFYPIQDEYRLYKKMTTDTFIKNVKLWTNMKKNYKMK